MPDPDVAWGKPVRLAGGTLTHYAGADQTGTSWLAHGEWAWTDSLRAPREDAWKCDQCVRKLPVLARRLQRAIEEGIL